MTALEEIKKAMEDVTTERVERLWWFLHILSKSTGTTNAEDDKWNWINAFCTDYEDDTFNLAAKLGFITVRHDSFMETSTARITKAGMALVAHFDKAPSAALTSTLESLQRENEELRADVKREAELATHMANDCNDAQARAEAAEAEVKRLREALKPFGRAITYCEQLRKHGGDDSVRAHDFVISDEFRTARQALASTGGEHHAE